MIHADSSMHRILRYVIGGVVMVLPVVAGCDRQPSAAPAGVIAPVVANSDAPTIVVDTQHELRERGAAGTPYVLNGGAGFVIDASTFLLRDPQAKARMPNSIQVIYNNSLFAASWPVTGRQISTLDRSTLKLVRGSDFSSFKSGTQAYIAIGHVAGASTGREPQFTPFWMTSVVFR